MPLDLWIWTAAIAISALIVATYSYSFARRGRADRRRLAEAQALGFDRPAGQYPHIDLELCIGCSACVDACPEGDVLGMVGGKAVVVNGIRCVGIAACEPACPVGAIEVGLGPIRGRPDLPVLDDEGQTRVPGLFVAGELSGLSLVHNAVNQGYRIVTAIAQRIAQDRQPGDLRDLIIIGAGPAGISAALAAVEYRLDSLTLEQEKDFGGTIFNYPRRKLVHTQPIEIPLYGSLEAGEHSKEDLLELFEDLRHTHQLKVVFEQRVTGLQQIDGGLRVLTENGAFEARFVVLALGRRGTPRKLGIPGESLPKVMYQVRDAALYTHQRILVVGGGDSAVEAALGLAAQPGNEVRLSYRRRSFARIKRKNQERLEKAIRKGELEAVLGSSLTAIEDTRVRLEVDGQVSVFENDAVFILAGGLAPFAMLKEMGIQFGDQIDGHDGSAAGA